MSITRKGLKAMGLTEEQVESIIDAHTETVDGLKDKLKAVQVAADKADELQKELDALKAKGEDGYKDKYTAEHAAFEAFKKNVAEKEAKAAKEAAARAYFEGKNITGTNLDIAMRAAAAEIGEIELDGEKIKDTAKLDALTSGTLAGLVKKTETRGAEVAHPPTGTSGTTRTKDEIMKIKDTAERQKAWGEYLMKERSN